MVSSDDGTTWPALAHHRRRRAAGRTDRGRPDRRRRRRAGRGGHPAVVQHLDSGPDVDIDGFPFLTQLVEGHYDEITVTATDVPVGAAQRLMISRLRVVLHDLTV